MRPRPEIIDQWSYFDYKPAMNEFKFNNLAPGWVPEDDRRRLTAYTMLAGYVRNNSRAWLPSTLNEDEILNRREYGDPATLVDSIVSSVMGESQKILVDGAVDEDPAIPGAVIQQILLEEWAFKERLMSKVLENERRTTELGDAVYVIGWDPEKNRPRLRVYDPGFYFPIIDPSNDSEYPKTVHLAWEFERKNEFTNEKQNFLRRITWALLPLEEPRRYPWQPPEEADSNISCFMWDGEWLLSEGQRGLFDLSEEAAFWSMYGVDLGFDFIPVVHLPNTSCEIEHFGVSSLARVLQILDDIVSTDTDLQASSATTGSPPIAITGTAIPTDDQGRITTYGPGTVLKTGDGNATMIDTSRSLDALLEYDKHLLSRLSVNSRIPEALLGRVKPNEVPSGIALTLSFTPHANLIKEMRLIRKQKYNLLLKFVSRMYLQFGLISEVFDANLVFGSFLPADKQEASTLVTQLLRQDRPLISLQTALELLVNAGVPIDDIQREIQRINSEDLNGSLTLLDATGDSGLVFQRLGLTASLETVTGDEIATQLQGMEGFSQNDTVPPQ